MNSETKAEKLQRRNKARKSKSVRGTDLYEVTIKH